MAGEGYVNFGYAGILLGPLVLLLVASALARKLEGTLVSPTRVDSRLRAVHYGYWVMIASGCQIGGIVGASTFPLTGFIVLSVLVRRTLRDE